MDSFDSTKKIVGDTKGCSRCWRTFVKCANTKVI